MTQDFFNMYVERILNEIGELNKTKLLLQTQIAWNEKTIQEMSDLQTKLQMANNDLMEKLRVIREGKKNKQPKVSVSVLQNDTF